MNTAEIQDLQRALQESMRISKPKEPWVPKTNYGRLLKLYLNTEDFQYLSDAKEEARTRGLRY